MTTSQIKSAIATSATIIASIAAKLVPLSAVLPLSIAKWLPVVVIVTGAIYAAFQQSLSGSHVSIPVEQAQALTVNVSAATLAGSAPSLVKQIGGEGKA